MKLVTFEVQGVERIGFLLNGKVVDLTLSYATYLRNIEGETTPLRIANARIPPDMLKFLDGEDKALLEAKKACEYVSNMIENGKEVRAPNGAEVAYEMDIVRLKAPIPRPRLMVDFSTFEEHVKMAYEKLGMDVPKEWYQIPVGYKMNPSSVIGTGEPIVWPKFTQLLDYELELGIVIGKKGRDIKKEDAYEHVFGYTIVNDVSARDIELLELRAMPLGPLKSKDFDNGTVIGPCIVTRDEIKDPHNLKMIARVNGEVWSEANTKDMYWKIPDLIEHLSRDQTIYPGTVILSGTPGGGCGMHLGRLIRPGDIIEMEIEGIGTIRNQVVKAE
ncbi:fumarylacetoacetate hydrolase family protein [Archaeoglobus neptunius]|uniref:fumarylacetoacetate hydrolase family protein n=1 Tax=Archaeoglobus neptunius TaxID=2798580 RepID=UPI001927E2E9|nr:fumarylacetoacetate hydrolase family protein [Archaeoglobus neptunius]